MPGRSIRIFLPDGSPSGLRTAEVGLSTIKAVVAPRTLLSKLAARPESKRTGVYLLVGDDPDIPGRQMVYVGEGDEVINRVSNHDGDGGKDFFDSVILFVSKDENLTKAHVRWLEAQLVGLLKAANRCTVANKTAPIGGMLPESDIAEMGEFLDQIQLLLSSLGLNLFEPVAKPTLAPVSPGHAEPVEDVVLYCAGEGYNAQCAIVEGAFVVKEGSVARAHEAETLPKSAKATRAELLDAGVLRPDDVGLVFVQDYEFSSASRAAQVVCGFSVNGWIAWKLESGQTLESWQAETVVD